MQMLQFIRMTADEKDILSIRNLARVTFPATYSSIISAEQIDFMMDMMYSETVLRRELEGGVTFLMLLAVLGIFLIDRRVSAQKAQS